MHFWIGFLALLLLAAVVFLVKYFRCWRRVDRELKAVRDELEIQREAARQEQKRKKDLVAFLAHDLKTPLTSVVGYLTLLSDKPGLYPAERERYTAVALEKARRLESLLEEFFDISRMELHQDSDKRETDSAYPATGTDHRRILPPAGEQGTETGGGHCPRSGRGRGRGQAGPGLLTTCCETP